VLVIGKLKDIGKKLYCWLEKHIGSFISRLDYFYRQFCQEYPKIGKVLKATKYPLFLITQLLSSQTGGRFLILTMATYTHSEVEGPATEILFTTAILTVATGFGIQVRRIFQIKKLEHEAMLLSELYRQLETANIILNANPKLVEELDLHATHNHKNSMCSSKIRVTKQQRTNWWSKMANKFKLSTLESLLPLAAHSAISLDPLTKAIMLAGSISTYGKNKVNNIKTDEIKAELTKFIYLKRLDHRTPGYNNLDELAESVAIQTEESQALKEMIQTKGFDRDNIDDNKFAFYNGKSRVSEQHKEFMKKENILMELLQASYEALSPNSYFFYIDAKRTREIFIIASLKTVKTLVVATIVGLAIQALFKKKLLSYIGVDAVAGAEALTGDSLFVNDAADIVEFITEETIDIATPAIFTAVSVTGIVNVATEIISNQHTPNYKAGWLEKKGGHSTSGNGKAQAIALGISLGEEKKTIIEHIQTKDLQNTPIKKLNIQKVKQKEKSMDARKARIHSHKKMLQDRITKESTTINQEI
jgi:hypothetical protein